MNFAAKDLTFDALVLAASATSAGSNAAVRERSVRPAAAPSTGEVRLSAGAPALAAMTPTADIQDPVRVRSWSPPV
jgi:hypothetical protein